MRAHMHMDSKLNKFLWFPQCIIHLRWRLYDQKQQEMANLDQLPYRAGHAILGKTHDNNPRWKNHHFRWLSVGQIHPSVWRTKAGDPHQQWCNHSKWRPGRWKGNCIQNLGQVQIQLSRCWKMVVVPKPLKESLNMLFVDKGIQKTKNVIVCPLGKPPSAPPPPPLGCEI